MLLLDSNIIIYAAQPAHNELRSFIAEHAPVVSIISYVEVLGFHRLQERDRDLLEQFFAATEVLPLSDVVARRAVALRQTRSMSLGDAVIAGTALVHGRTLVTHNTADFRGISALQILDPLASGV